VAKRVGIIGLGKMGILHAGIVNSLPDSEVTAICEKERFLIRSAKAIIPNVNFYTDHSRMIAKEDLDAIFVTTPIHTHVPLVIDIATTNPSLSIFVEKPLASSKDLANKACRVAKKLTGTHMVGFQKRFSPIFLKMKETLEKGDLGQIMFFKAYSFSSDVLREGSAWRFKPGTGGVLLDLAPHVLDLMLWLFGEPERVHSVTSHIYSSRVEDYVHTILSYKTGFKGHVDICWSMSKFRLPEICIEVFGKDGSLVASDDYLKISKYGSNGAEQVYYKPSLQTSVPFLLAEPEFTKEDEAFLCHNKNTPDFFEAARVNMLIHRILS
jgi:predicted dehydrogenase